MKQMKEAFRRKIKVYERKLLSPSLSNETRYTVNQKLENAKSTLKQAKEPEDLAEDSIRIPENSIRIRNWIKKKLDKVRKEMEEDSSINPNVLNSPTAIAMRNAFQKKIEMMRQQRDSQGAKNPFNDDDIPMSPTQKAM